MKESKMYVVEKGVNIITGYKEQYWHTKIENYDCGIEAVLANTTKGCC